MFTFENKEEFEAAIKSYLQENIRVYVFSESENCDVEVWLGDDRIN
jgi:hypothetical protein